MNIVNFGPWGINACGFRMILLNAHWNLQSLQPTGLLSNSGIQVLVRTRSYFSHICLCLNWGRSFIKYFVTRIQNVFGRRGRFIFRRMHFDGNSQRKSDQIICEETSWRPFDGIWRFSLILLSHELISHFSQNSFIWSFKVTKWIAENRSTLHWGFTVQAVSGIEQ